MKSLWKTGMSLMLTASIGIGSMPMTTYAVNPKNVESKAPKELVTNLR